MYAVLGLQDGGEKASLLQSSHWGLLILEASRIQQLMDEL